MQSGLSRNPPSGSPGSDGPTQLALSAEPLEGRGVADFGAFPFESEQQHNVMNAADPHNLLGSSPFQDFSFPFQDTRDQDDHMSDLEDHQDGNDVAADQADISAAGERPDTIAAGYANSEALRERQPSDSRSDDGAYDGAYDGNHATGHSMEDHASDEFGFSVHPSGNGTGLGGKLKQHGKSDAAPAWSELKTKAGKERKRLPLACASCRRKKIRCSGEKPACKHCIRSRIPCVYKVTTRRAAPRTDYMAMLDKRLKRMEDRIIKIVPKSEQDASAATVVRATVKPPLPGTLSAAGKQATKKRTADEAFSTELESWAKSKSTPEDSSKNGLLQTQEEEENKILHEGQDALPSKELQEHLAEVYFEVVYGQAYHLLHKPSYMRKLRSVPARRVSVFCLSVELLPFLTFDEQSRYITASSGPRSVRGLSAILISFRLRRHSKFPPGRGVGCTCPGHCEKAVRMAKHYDINLLSSARFTRIRHVPWGTELDARRRCYPNGVCLATPQRRRAQPGRRQGKFSA